MMLLLLLLFFNPDGFYLRDWSGSYSQVCLHRVPFYTFSPPSRWVLVTTHSFPFYKGRGHSPNQHLAQPTFGTVFFCGINWGETTPPDLRVHARPREPSPSGRTNVLCTTINFVYHSLKYGRYIEYKLLVGSEISDNACVDIYFLGN